MGTVQVTEVAEEEEQVTARAPFAAALGVSEASEVVDTASPCATRQVMPRARRTRSLALVRPRLQTLPRKAKRAALLVPAVFTLLCMALMDDRLNLLPPYADFGLLLAAGIASFALVSGALLRSKRLGALVGFLMGAGMFAAIAVMYVVMDPEPVTSKDIARMCCDWSGVLYWAPYLSGFTLGGALFGMAGAIFRQKLLQIRPCHVRLIAR